MSRPKKPEIALIYDFDGTLAPGNMQERAFIPSLGMQNTDFWGKAKALARENDGDEILMYMELMLEEAKSKGLQTTRKAIRKYGKDIELFDGVQTWFDRINRFADTRNLVARHYIISSGNREIIEGTSIAKKFERIYASTFRYDANDAAEAPALAINYTTKTQYLFRINKGALDLHDHDAMHEYTPRATRKVPFDRMIFMGDGDSDVPCMRLVRQQGGFSVAVYKPNSSKAKEKADKLIEQRRVHFVAPADYRQGSRLDLAVQRRIELIAAVEEFRRTIDWYGQQDGAGE